MQVVLIIFIIVTTVAIAMKEPKAKQKRYY